jgi:transposase
MHLWFARRLLGLGLTVFIVNAVMVCMARKSFATKSVKKRRRVRPRSLRSEADVRTEHALLQLARNVKRNSPIIRRKLREAGINPNPSLVFATAMYFDALDRLAKE